MRIIYSILLLTFISGHLFAQRSETVQTNDSTFSVIKQLKEVVITAEKRELSISEIPVALSVISGKNLLNRISGTCRESFRISTCRKVA